jgi:hypothetical protein
MSEVTQTEPTPPELRPYVSTGPSAAFFDLDRTLISGSSAFVLGGRMARRASSAETPSARSRSDSAAPATTPPMAFAIESSAL